MSNTYSKLRFSKFKKLLSRSAFGELQLSLISKVCFDFDFERNQDVLKSKSLCFLLNKNINFNKHETESKMENPPHTFTETNLVLQLANWK